jgi:hypothetical protein
MKDQVKVTTPNGKAEIQIDESRLAEMVAQGFKLVVSNPPKNTTKAKEVSQDGSN